MTTYSTVPPWLQRKALPLIGAITGAPVPEFPPGGSEVVELRSVLQSHLSIQAPLWAAYLGSCLRQSILIYADNNTFFPGSQIFLQQNYAVEKNDDSWRKIHALVERKTCIGGLIWVP